MTNAEPSDEARALQDALEQVESAEWTLRKEFGKANDLVIALANAVDAIREQLGAIKDGIPSTSDASYAVEVAR